MRTISFVATATLVLWILATGCASSDDKVCSDAVCDAGPPAPDVAMLEVSPNLLKFGPTGQGETDTAMVTLENVGAVPVKLVRLQASATCDSCFGVAIGELEWPVGGETGNSLELVEPVELAPGQQREIAVRFQPTLPDVEDGKLWLYTDEAGIEREYLVTLLANQSIPCLTVIPANVDFHSTPVGSSSQVEIKIGACGESPVQIYGISLTQDSSADFQLDLSNLEHPPSSTDPIVVSAADAVQVTVVFAPDVVNPPGVEGAPAPDLGSLVIEADSFFHVHEVPLSGVGVDTVCPTSVIKCTEGEEVIPQTLLHLYGDESSAPVGEVVKWKWEVVQPLGSQSVFVPASTFPNPTFAANVVGNYTISLTTWDQADTPSCFPAKYQVTVMPDEAIHIELLWYTPEDPDETDTGDEAGSDVDLHFLHPDAAGPDLDGDGKPDGWYDIPYDCFFFNPYPNWGDYAPAAGDDPGLDRDDMDGAGPEILNLNVPEDVKYRVGAHYWNPHGFGDVFATLRVYIYAQLVTELATVKLVDNDMWDACILDWQSGEVEIITDAFGQYKITPHYQNPYFFQ